MLMPTCRSNIFTTHLATPPPESRCDLRASDYPFAMAASVSGKMEFDRRASGIGLSVDDQLVDVGAKVSDRRRQSARRYELVQRLNSGFSKAHAIELEGGLLLV